MLEASMVNKKFWNFWEFVWAQVCGSLDRVVRYTGNYVLQNESLIKQSTIVILNIINIIKTKTLYPQTLKKYIINVNKIVFNKIVL